MRTKRGLWSAVVIASIAVLCIAGTKISRITQTATIQGDSLFLVVTGAQANGTLETRSIEASNLLSGLTNLPGWPTSTGGSGSATNVDVRTNSNQFGAAGTTLTLKKELQVTNLNIFGTMRYTNPENGGSLGYVTFTDTGVFGDNGGVFQVGNYSGPLLDFTASTKLISPNGNPRASLGSSGAPFDQVHATNFTAKRSVNLQGLAAGSLLYLNSGKDVTNASGTANGQNVLRDDGVLTAISNKIVVAAGTGGITVTPSGAGGVMTFTVADDDAGGGNSTNTPAGATIYVDAVYGVDATGARGNASRPFLSLTNALRHATNGDTVKIRAGTYVMNSVTNSVGVASTSMAALASKTNVVIEGSGSGTILSFAQPGGGFTIFNSSNITLRSLSMSGVRSNIDVSSFAIDFRGTNKWILIDDVHLRQFSDHVIGGNSDVDTADNVWIRNSSASGYGVSYAGESLPGDGAGVQVCGTYWTIDNCTFQDGIRGIEIWNLGGKTTGPTLITRCTFRDLWWYGISTEGTMNLNNQISAIDNSFFDFNTPALATGLTNRNDMAAIKIDGGSDHKVANNRIRSIRGAAANTINQGIGISLYYPSRSQIDNNTVTDCKLIGISLDAFTGGSHGSNIVFSRNSVSSNGGSGIRLYGGLGVQARDNTVFDNGQLSASGSQRQGIYVQLGTNAIISGNILGNSPGNTSQTPDISVAAAGTNTVLAANSFTSVTDSGTATRSMGEWVNRTNATFGSASISILNGDMSVAVGKQVSFAASSGLSFFGDLDPTSTNFIHSLAEDTVPAAGDYIITEDVSTGMLKKVTRANFDSGAGGGEANVNGEVAVTNATRFGLVNGKSGVTNLLRSIAARNGLVGTNESGTNISFAIDPAIVPTQAQLTAASNSLAALTVANDTVTSNGVMTFLGTNVISLSTSNATSKPLSNSYASGILKLYGLEVGNNITLTPNGSNIVIASTASGSSGGTNYPPVIHAGTNITLGVGVRQHRTISTNASFGVNFQGTALNGETVRVGVSNYSTATIYMTNFQGGTVANAYVPAIGGVSSVFTIGPTSISVFEFVWSTNFQANGSVRQELQWSSGFEYLLGSGAAHLVMVTNGSTIVFQVTNFTGSGAIVLSNAPTMESPIFLSNPTAPTPSPGDADTSLATTAFVNTSQINSNATFASIVTRALTNLVSLTLSNATKIPLVVGVGTTAGATNSTGIIRGLEAGANVTLSENGSNVVITGSAGGSGFAALELMTNGTRVGLGTNINWLNTNQTYLEVTGMVSGSIFTMRTSLTNAALTNLAGTVSSNVTNENSAALQINTGTLTLTPGNLSNIVTTATVTNFVGQSFDYGLILAATNTVAGTNLTINFAPNATNHLDIYTTNWWCQWTNISGLATGNLANKTIRITPSAPGQNLTNVWPVGSQHGIYRWQTNANAVFWNVLTNSKTYVVSMTAYGTNIHATISLWEQ